MLLPGGGQRYRSSLRSAAVGGWSVAMASRPAGGLFALAQALHETDRRAGKIKFGAQLVFEKTLVAEVQRRFLIGEQEKGGRSGFGLRDVVDAHGAGFRRAPALEVDLPREPIVQRWRG